MLDYNLLGSNTRSNNGYLKASYSNSVPILQTPSNVTQISRCFKRKCLDGTFQTIYYHSGVGSTTTVVSQLLGAAFGIGMAEVRIQHSLSTLEASDVIIEHSRGVLIHLCQLCGWR